MVSAKTTGSLLVGSSIIFSAILYLTTKSLSAKSSAMGCLVNTPGCQQVTSSLTLSYVAVGFLSALVSLGLFFLLFYKEPVSSLDLRKERIELLSKLLTPGEMSVIDVLSKENGILQSTLRYRTNLTPGRVSQVLSDFEKQGLISREPYKKSYKVFLRL